LSSFWVELELHHKQGCRYRNRIGFSSNCLPWPSWPTSAAADAAAGGAAAGDDDVTPGFEMGRLKTKIKFHLNKIKHESTRTKLHVKAQAFAAAGYFSSSSVRTEELTFAIAFISIDSKKADHLQMARLFLNLIEEELFIDIMKDLINDEETLDHYEKLLADRRLVQDDPNDETASAAVEAMAEVLNKHGAQLAKLNKRQQKLMEQQEQQMEELTRLTNSVTSLAHSLASLTMSLGKVIFCMFVVLAVLSLFYWQHLDLSARLQIVEQFMWDLQHQLHQHLHQHEHHQKHHHDVDSLSLLRSETSRPDAETSMPDGLWTPQPRDQRWQICGQNCRSLILGPICALSWLADLVPIVFWGCCTLLLSLSAFAVGRYAPNRVLPRIETQMIMDRVLACVQSHAKDDKLYVAQHSPSEEGLSDIAAESLACRVPVATGASTTANATKPGEETPSTSAPLPSTAANATKPGEETPSTSAPLQRSSSSGGTLSVGSSPSGCSEQHFFPRSGDSPECH